MLRFHPRNAAVKILPIDLPTTRRPIGIITLKNRSLSPVAQLFIACARELAARSADRNQAMPARALPPRLDRRRERP
jgi:DNA-binding transcriptional LysR family regulator